MTTSETHTTEEYDWCFEQNIFLEIISLQKVDKSFVSFLLQNFIISCIRLLKVLFLESSSVTERLEREGLKKYPQTSGPRM